MYSVLCCKTDKHFIDLSSIRDILDLQRVVFYFENRLHVSKTNKCALKVFYIDFFLLIRKLTHVVLYGCNLSKFRLSIK